MDGGKPRIEMYGGGTAVVFLCGKYVFTTRGAHTPDEALHQYREYASTDEGARAIVAHLLAPDRS